MVQRPQLDLDVLSEDLLQTRPANHVRPGPRREPQFRGKLQALKVLKNRKAIS